MMEVVAGDGEGRCRQREDEEMREWTDGRSMSRKYCRFSSALGQDSSPQLLAAHP